MDSRFRGNDEVISANFSRKLSLEFPRIFLQKRGECGNLSVKMDSRFRGNDEVNFANFTRKLNLKISVFFRKKRGECGDLSVKMDSRFRGNDEVNSVHFTRKLNLEFPRKRKNFTKNKIYHSGERRNLCGDSDFHRNGNAAKFREKTPSFPRKRESIRGD